MRSSILPLSPLLLLTFSFGGFFAQEHDPPDEPSPEVPAYTYIEDQREIDFFAKRMGVSNDVARDALAFEQLALKVGDAIFAEFESDLITTKVDSVARHLVIYVSGRQEAIADRAAELMGDSGGVIVQDGFLPLTEMRNTWQLIEDSLIADGLAVMGAIRPNALHIETSNVERAQALVDAVPTPTEVTITFAGGGRGEDLHHLDPRGGWADGQSFSSGSYSNWCTLGFAATDDQGRAGMVTAGHCPESSGTRLLATAPGYLSGSSCVTERRILQYFNDANNSELDAQFQYEESGSAGSCIGTFMDDVCSESIHRASNGGFHECTDYVDIGAWTSTNPIDGQVRAFGSKVAGLAIGVIVDNLYDPCGPCSADYVKVDYDGGFGFGDSGGPVRSGSTIHGITKGRDLNDFSLSWYSKARWIDPYGMHPATSPVGPNP